MDNHNKPNIPEGAQPVRYSALKGAYENKKSTNVRSIVERYLIVILLLFGIYFAVSMGWTLIETILTGTAVKTVTDGVIAIILSVSLLFNLDSWIKGGK